MGNKPQHTKILNDTAKKILTPIGLKKYESRLWIDDNGWWMICVEFQASSWSKGSYLNVGCTWLLYPRNHIVFDEGHRQYPFVEYEDNNQFQDAADRLCILATEKVKTFRNQFKSMQDVLSRINEKIDDQGRIKKPLFEIRRYGPWFSKRRLDLWSTYYSAVLSGLIGKVKEADKFFKIIIEAQKQFDWWVDVRKTAKSLQEELHDPISFRAIIADFVNQYRMALNLIPLEKPFGELKQDHPTTACTGRS